MSGDELGPDKPMITIFTIGFAGKSAREFFEKLRQAGVKLLVDIRLNNVSQLAGFTKKKDLEYFLQAIAGIRYAHEQDLAPTQDVLDDYKKKRIDWQEYERRFLQILQDRAPAEHLIREDFDRACLLCSEAQPDKCHRRLTAEYLQRCWGIVEIKHL